MSYWCQYQTTKLLYTVPQTVVIHIGSNDITRMNYKLINVQDLVQGINLTE